MALFVPFISGNNHSAQAIAAGRSLVEKESNDSRLVEAGVRFGVGVHTGEAYVGTLGSGEKLDFSALGDTVNSAARRLEAKTCRRRGTRDSHLTGAR